MGNDQSKQNEQPISKVPSQKLHKIISTSIKQRKLKLLYCQDLKEILTHLIYHLNDYVFEQLLLDDCKLKIQEIEIITKMDLKIARQKIKVINFSMNYVYQIKGHNQLTSENIKPIINLHLINLTTLYLDHNNLRTDGCYYLTKPKLQSLQTLDLTKNQIDDEGCRILAGAGNWPQLRTLLISQNKFTTKGLLYLSKGEWPVLIFLKASKNSFEPSQKLSQTKFRTQVKGFTLQLY